MTDTEPVNLWRNADHAVNYTLPGKGGTFNPAHLADAEAVVQPGTGRIRAIAEDRQYGSGRGRTTIDYAVTTPYDGGIGVQTGSSSKLFTLITALEQGIPFGYSMTVPNSATLTGYFSCNGDETSPFKVVNASKGDAGPQTLYTGTTFSVNTFYAALEKKVGLCQVVKTAASLGMTWGNGTSLFKSYDGGYPADQLASFTLGSANVAPLSMADAYATVAARGVYCAPVAIDKVVALAGKSLGVPRPGCHRVLSQEVSDAVNYILQGVLTQSGATADNRGIGRPAAAKTGTAGSATTAPPSAAFAGYTPTLVGYVWVGGPFHTIYMTGEDACYRETSGYLSCPGSMFGDDAPGATWQTTFLHANLGPAESFVPVDPSSALFSMGTGQSAPKPKKQSGGGGPGGGGSPSPNPTGFPTPKCPHGLPICPG